MHDFNLRDPGTFRLLWRFPNLLFPALIAVVVQVLADSVFRGASAVVEGDSGIILFLRVVACVISVMLPAIAWAGAAIVTTIIAGDAWEMNRTNWQDALATARFGLLPRRAILGVIAGGYIVFLVLGVLLNHFADIVFAATMYFLLLALPATVIDERPLVGALQASRSIGLRYPLFISSAFVMPAVVVFIAAILATISLGVAYFGVIAAALSTAFAFTFTIAHVSGVYLDAVRSGEPETIALGPPLPPPEQPAEVIDAEFIRTHFPPYQ